MNGQETKARPAPFYKLTQIQEVYRDESSVIKTGNSMLDKRIMGLTKGELSIVSGSNGSGKSSWLSQVAVEAADQGHRTALFSGELTPQRVRRWLELPAAGREHTVATAYENLYYVTLPAQKKIRAWLDDKVFIYNNEYGMDVDKLMDALERCVASQKLSLVIIDNLMALDLRKFGADKYERQTLLVNQLSDKAKTWDVHIVFVCHPRKAMGFLRKDDISGTADLTNAADNVFIIHRVNKDFEKHAGEHLGKLFIPSINGATNVIEVCKNRDLGIQDLFCHLYFERQSGRFLNFPSEDKHYGWERL